ncbi:MULTISPECIES: hypothetical protein [Rhodobacterales]|uniref:DUF296 domain-containing protein n=3 Tax=Rhodobacterales TaxID=204455 RepID=A0A0P1IQI1_9RHOB|nr:MULTISPECIES: hypothetical protein [Rhodobacterales]CUH58747.1 hypothetical protein THS5294_00025 [Thalassobacter stenotrophicus]CUI94005.1 hypothetical protein TA5113_01835 [Cognatishimia activa]CUK25812.1 hypothetical protein TA5114_01616 [Cognatishimia activa]SHJ38978.1 hypothetical protein SAMN02744035_03588 [Thalassobacter stenotrophicus DSM 16310]
MKLVKHPGPVRATRCDLVPCAGHEIEVTLAADIPLMQSVEQALSPLGIDGAWLECADAPVSTLSYVGPVIDSGQERAAWYSATRQFEQGRIERIGMMVGQHEGAFFLHGHGLWGPTEGPLLAGHILAGETRLSKPVTAKGLAIDGAMFDRRPDAETKFDLFHAVETTPSQGDLAALRLMPNQDVTTAIDNACMSLGWDSAQVYGLGSLNGVTLEGGAGLSPQPTEFLIEKAAAGTSALPPEIIIVGLEGTPIQKGRLVRGENAVLITAELILRRTQH